MFVTRIFSISVKLIPP